MDLPNSVHLITVQSVYVILFVDAFHGVQIEFRVVFLLMHIDVPVKHVLQ